MPLAAKRARAGRVVENSGSLPELESSVEKLARDLGLRPERST